MTHHHLYIIGVNPNGPIKIGVSTNIKSRHATLQTGFHLKLDVIKKWRIKPEAAYRLENIAHAALSNHRLNGEWFSCHALQAISEVESILEATKNGMDLSIYMNRTVDPIKCAAAQVGGKISAALRRKESLAGAEKIKDRWGLPSKIWPTKVLLKEANFSYNTAITIPGLGPRPIAQYNYQAKLKRKERRDAKREVRA